MSLDRYSHFCKVAGFEDHDEVLLINLRFRLFACHLHVPLLFGVCQGFVSTSSVVPDERFYASQAILLTISAYLAYLATPRAGEPSPLEAFVKEAMSICHRANSSGMIFPPRPVETHIPLLE
jgi:hypothetical protein